MKRLKHSEIKPFRENKLGEQDNKCTLCEQSISLGDAALDHDHKSGVIRDVLHKGCNALLGKIENALVINRIGLDILEVILSNVPSYLRGVYKEIYHPTHKTVEEKKERAKRLAKKRRERKKQDAQS